MTDGFTALLRGGTWFDVSGEYGGVAVRVPLSEYHHQNQFVRRDGGRSWPMLFSNSGLGVKLSTIIPAGPTVLSAVGACPPHDGVR
jgi:hypothetical protein